MKHPIQTSEVLTSAVDVWSYLNKQGGLDLKRYDADLLEELRARLSLPATEDLEVSLKGKKTSVEDFVVAFFQAVQPFAEMMSDILYMFEKAGAKQTNDNIMIQFHFDDNLPVLGFDLSHFRSWVETWRKVAGNYLKNLWDYHTLWKLNEAVRGWNVEVNNPVMQRWLKVYRAEFSWPDFVPPAPQSGDQLLDDALARVWRIWETVVRESAKYGASRENLRDFVSRTRKSPKVEGQPDLDQGAWPPRFLGMIDSDHWADSLARGAYHRVETISALPSTERQAAADDLRNQIEAAFRLVPQVQVEGETLLHQLEEFLNLPIWKRRHELYSVWIGSRILNALEGESVRVHQADGILLFSFSGTHLATADAFEPRLHVWAELRTPLVSPIGKGRKRAIQPDYSLITDPVTNPLSSILEVECKQYRRPSTNNFSAALSDYARGRPRAHVLLVNYGPASQLILSKVPPDLRSRTSLIGRMRPDSIAAQEEFKRIINEALKRKYIHIGETEPDKINLTSTGQVALFWRNLPCDLDLHLKIDTPDGKTYKINFSQTGDAFGMPWARLDRDIRSGYGPETIEVARFVEGKYHFAAHNYSNDASLAGSGARLTFSCGQQHWQYQCPEEGSGRWWSIFKLDAKTGTVEEINRIIEQLWQE